MKKMEDMSKEGGEEERRDEKKEKGAKEGEGKAPGWIWCWEEEKKRQKEAPVNEERKKQGHLVPASVLTPNTLVPC